MKLALIREGKTPPDKRVALIPAQAKKVKQENPELELVVQKSPIRCYADEEYQKNGLPLADEVKDADVLIGIKEVPVPQLLADKTYFFFSHTIKAQPYNRNLLQTVLKKNITLVDWETLVEDNGARVIAFGRFAGLVGAYNGLRAYGKKHNIFELKPAHLCFDLAEMKQELDKVRLPKEMKIVITGAGRVGNGAAEIIDHLKVKKVSADEYVKGGFDQAVYAQLEVDSYNKRKDGSTFVMKDFFEEPELFESDFAKFTSNTDLLIAGAFWAPEAPVLFTAADMQAEHFAINTIADITCDIEGSIPSTKRPSTIADPFYDYQPATGELTEAFSSESNITVMAVDNLPNELPRDASESFGEQFMQHVLPALTGKADYAIIERATIAKGGKLTERFGYLQEFVEGK